MSKDFWQGRRVLITGHTGFKGAWLSLWLDSLGAEVTGYSRKPPTEPNLFDQTGVARRVRSVTGDVQDGALLSKTVKDWRPEVVIHMAAQSVVKTGYDDPVDTFDTNVMGTVRVLDTLRRAAEPCAVVVVTSDKCYAPQANEAAHGEDDPMGGDDPYSSSKGCAELVTAAFRHSFFPPESLVRHGIAVATARAGNAIGGGDWTAHQLIPDLFRAFAEGHACPIRNPNAVRPWQFVLEPLRGYLMLAERLAGSDAAPFADGWNFGPAATDARPVSWLADQCVRAWGGNAAWTRDHSVHPSETSVLRLDATKAATRLGWVPVLPLDRALEWTAEWYRAWKDAADLTAVTCEQIDRYERLAVPEAGQVVA
jgi:CDP-glucose 4,6-dehydratase